MIKLAPSLLAADMSNLQQEVARVEDAGAEYLHLDIMDGHFVPNITYGADIVKALRSNSKMVFDAHLMISKPELYLEDFAKAGADIITVHIETCPHLHSIIQQIKALDCKAAVALNPATPLITLEEILPELDMVLLMSVNPGFGGQSFIPNSINKIKRLKSLLDAKGLASQIDIQVDGGIKLDNIAQVYDAGANIMVSGSGIFGQSNIKQTIDAMREACK